MYGSEKEKIIMKKTNLITIVEVLYCFCVLIVFLTNIMNYKIYGLYSFALLSISIILLLYPLIRKKIILSCMRKKELNEKDVFAVYEFFSDFLLIVLKKSYVLLQERKKFDDEKTATKETLDFIEDELIEISDAMTGEAYERLVGFCLMKSGWKILEYTEQSGDFGADIIAENPEGRKFCIQCKRYNKKVSLDAVQQVYAAIKYYDCEKGMVITNSKFTRSAHKLARKTEVLLRESFPQKSEIKFYKD